MTIQQEYIEKLEKLVISLSNALDADQISISDENIALISEVKANVEAKGIPIEMNHVTSTNIDSIGYNSEHKLLRVKFINGTIYQYSGVPEDVNKEMLLCESVGSYFNKSVKAVFPCVKL